MFGVERLVRLMGVETRASGKEYLPRFFRVIIETTPQHGHTNENPYRENDKSRL